MKNKLIAACFTLASANTIAGAYTGTIKAIVCHEAAISSVCQISVNGTPPGLPCASSSWRYTMDGTTTEGRNMLSILLAAQVSRQQITIGGKGACTLSGASEDIRHVYINTPE